MLPTHFPSVRLSNWQSSVAKIARPPDPSSEDFNRPPLDFDDARVLAANAAAFAADEAEQGRDVEPPTDRLHQAAKAALDLGTALVHGEPDEVTAAKAAFMRFGKDDPFWIECVTEFVEHYTLTRHSAVPYIKYHSLTDCILPPGTLPPRCRIAVIGDWGTGDTRAEALLAEVARQKPDILVHLGDIYYACTALEANAFYDNLMRGFGPRRPRVFTLCGNHDMYSGAAPYYALLKRLGQPASFFCLRNPDWQILAADTGYNDFNPFKRAEDATWVRDRDEGETYSELDWHKDKLVNAGSRRTILMTHHPLFTRNSSIAGKVVNPYLKDQFGDFLSEIALWLWGHEHNLVVYEPFQGLAKGRCVGASAVPVSTNEDLLVPCPLLQGQEVPSLMVQDGEPVRLRSQAREGLYQLGYALIDLDGPEGLTSYIQFDPSTGIAIKLYEEIL